MKKVNVAQILPKGQKEIIKKALELQYKAIDGNGLQGDAIEYMKHDIRSLIAFLDYDISVTLSKDMKDKFAFLHGVDFPEYTDVDAKYPIEVEPKSEWVTLMTGDFSFIDDDVHARECYVNTLHTVEKHLREQVGEVIDCVENDGGGWVVIEDYDGHIVMNFDKDNKVEVDKRNFQVVWLESHYPDANTMVEDREFFNDNGFTDEDINRIEALDVSDQCITEEGGVIIIRLSDSE